MIELLCNLYVGYSYKQVGSNIMPIIQKLIDVLDITVLNTRTTKTAEQCVICKDESIELINIHCNKQFIHCYCLSCLKEMHNVYKTCVICLHRIDVGNFELIKYDNLHEIKQIILN